MKKTIIISISLGIVLISLILGYRMYEKKQKENCTKRAMEVEEELKRQEIQTITPKQAKEKMTQEENLIILDVRTQEEYQQGYIPKSQLLPLQELENRVDKEIQDKSTPILVYCRSGVRSKKACEILVKKGYKKVWDMGGILDWPYEIERNEM